MLFLMLGYFLKDLHKDFKELIIKVNALYSRFESHLTRFDSSHNSLKDKINNLKEQLKVLSSRIFRLETKDNRTK